MLAYSRLPNLSGGWKSIEEPPGIRLEPQEVVVRGPTFRTVNVVAVVLPVGDIRSGRQIGYGGGAKCKSSRCRQMVTRDAELSK